MTSFAMRHKILVVCFWMLFTVCGARFVGTMMHRMDYTYTTLGQPGYIANQHSLRQFWH